MILSLDLGGGGGGWNALFEVEVNVGGFVCWSKRVKYYELK